MKEELKKLIEEWKRATMNELGYPEYMVYDYSFSNFIEWLEKKE